MTNKAYEKSKQKDKQQLSISVMARIQETKAVYRKAFDKMKHVISSLPKTELSGKNKDRLLAAYNRGTVQNSISGIIQTGINKAIDIGLKTDRQFMKEAAKEAGLNLDTDKAFDRVKTRLKAKQAVNYQLVTLVKNRSGYSLSASVWDAVDGFSDRILAIIEAELEAGTDPAKISRIIEEYLSSGSPDKILGRWGQLEIGTSEYRKRLGTSGADYRTQRVVRTEMWQTVRQTDIDSGVANPGSTGMFNWKLSGSHIDWGCICPEAAAGSPYTQDQVQELKDGIHPNCLCMVTPALKDHDTFIQQLKDFAQGRDTAGAQEIEAWAEKYNLT